MADTAALVVALSAQLTKFEKDMQKAGIMAEKAVGDIENKFSKMNPQVNASFFGNLFANMASKGIDAAVKGIEDLISRFQDLQNTAEYTGASLGWIYGMQDALSKGGASAAEFNTALKGVAFSLDEMKRGGDNPLKMLLEAPGNQSFLKGFNKDTAAAEETMQRVLNIISKMPNMIQAIDVGKNLGIPASVAAAAWKEGGDAIAAAAAKASSMGPALEKMAAQSKAIADAWKLFSDYLSAGFIDLVFEKLKLRLEQIVALFEKLQFGQEGTVFGNFIDSALPKLREFRAALDETAKPPKKVEVRGGTAEDPYARKNTVANQRDEFERANDQITKHIALMEADAAAVGKGVAEQERLRTTTILMEAERRRLNLAEGAAITISDELAAKIAKQAAAAGAAAQKLAEANYKMQQMNAASQQFGSALSNAFADAIIEGKRLNDVLSEMLKTLARAAIQWAIMAPFTPGAGGGVAPISKLFGFAGGTNFAPGGMALVGEKGPELVNLPRGSQVIPNDVLRQGGMGGGGAITYAPAIDARGASVEAVARLAQIMEQDRAAFASRTVAVIQQARRGRVPGL